MMSSGAELPLEEMSSDWFRYEKGIFQVLNVIMKFVPACDLKRYNLDGVDAEVILGLWKTLVLLQCFKGA